MKKFLVSGIVSLVAVVAVPLSASAIVPVSTPKGNTDVTGTVTYNGKTTKGVKVSVDCNGKSKNDTTDSAGDYLVVFKAKDCPAGSIVNVTASKNKENGVNSGTANALNTKLNIAMVNVTVALPEMGFVTGSVAATGAGGAFFLSRRRKLENK